MNHGKDSLKDQRIKRPLTIGLICVSVFYGLASLVLYPDSIPYFVGDIIVWSVFFVLWVVLLKVFTKIELDPKRIVWFCLSLVVAVAVMSLRPWMAIGLITQHVTGSVIFQLAVFSKLYIALMSVNFGIVITLTAITKTIPKDLRAFFRQVLMRSAIVAFVILVIALSELLILLYIPPEFTGVFFALDFTTTQLLCSPVYYYVITSFLSDTKPFFFPRRDKPNEENDD